MSAHRSRVTRSLELLTEGLYPFVEREMKSVYRDRWIESARESFRSDRGQGQPSGDAVKWDAHAILTVMWDQWNKVFRFRLGQPERSLVSELRDYRNRWAHQREFDFDDAYRVLDSVHRLLTAVAAPQAEQAARDKRELMRIEFDEEADARRKDRDFQRDKRTAVTIYAVCCFAIVFQLLSLWGSSALLVAAVVVLLFAYLTYQRLNLRPVGYGPHECLKCGKIIYSAECPYCEVRVERWPETASRQPEGSLSAG